MITMYERNSRSLAKINYRRQRKKKRLKMQLGFFFATLLPVCGALFIALSYAGQGL